MKYSIVHLHTDDKFIGGSRIFDSELFDNSLYFINSNNNHLNIFKINAKISSKQIDLIDLINKCNQSELVVIWGLSSLFYEIIFAISNNVKIAWRFFGYELYNKIPHTLYTNKTLRISYNPLKRLVIKSKFLQDILYKNSNKTFENVVQRINYFIGLSNKEYTYLNKQFNYLPAFIQSPYSRPTHDFIEKKGVVPKVVLGHNAHSINNHIDILYLIKDANINYNCSFNMLMSYGGSEKYISSIKNAASKIKNLTIIDNMMSRDEFNNFYNEITTFVLNSHRQCGMGNVFQCLRNGIKIYLNPNNIMYHWLLEENFIVFTIDNFKRDLENGDFLLSYSDSQNNYNSFCRITEKYSLEKFQNRIIEILN